MTGWDRAGEVVGVIDGKSVAQYIVNTRESFELGERLAIATSILVVMFLQIILTSKVLSHEEAEVLANLITVFGWTLDPWTIALYMLIIYLGMSFIRWVAKFALAIEAYQESDSA